MLKLPKEHLSVSQINLWESDPIAYQKKYFIGIEDPSSPFLEFGKQFAKDIEDYAAGVQRDFNFPEGFLDMTLIYPYVEYKLEHDFGDFKMLGYIDNMSKDYELVVDFKTGTAPWSTQRLQQSLQNIIGNVHVKNYVGTLNVGKVDVNLNQVTKYIS